MDETRIKELIEKYSNKSLLIFGVLMEDWIPNLEECEQFRPLSLDSLKTAAEKCKNTKNLAIMRHHFPFIKYIIRELRPTDILWVNGSQRNILHSHAHYWEGVNVEAKMKLVSPFSSEKAAKKRVDEVDEVDEVNQKKIKTGLTYLNTIKKPRPEDFMNFARIVGKCSWDWTGLHGATIVKDNKVLAYSHNRVLPYRSAIMHEGCRREKMLSPRGEDQDYTETNHAETSCLVKCASEENSIEDADLYTTCFPCPTCARVIADSPIKTIYYSDEYTNDIGYEILKRMGKKIVKL
jgi:dCMP deaminase